MNVFLAGVLISTGDNANDRFDALDEAAGEISRAMVRNFEHVRREREFAGIVLFGEEPARFIVQVPGEEVTEAAIFQTKDNGMPVDGVRGGITAEFIFSQRH